MTSRPFPLIFLIGLVTIFPWFARAESATAIVPILPTPASWEIGRAWGFKSVGNRDFYFAEMGNYLRVGEHGAPYRQTGLLDRLVPGHWDLKIFDSAEADKLHLWQKTLVDQWQTNRWPLHTIQYVVDHGRPLPSAAAIQRMDVLWIGDHQAEALPYRLDVVFDFLHEDKVWTTGSSFFPEMHEPMKKFFNETLLPRLQKELPFCRDKKHVWTRAEMRRLWDIWSEEFFKPIGRPVVWTTFNSCAHLAAMPDVRSVGMKSQDAYHNARARGLNRRNGGGKFFCQWLGHEPMEKYAYSARGLFYNEPNRDEWGYPLPHVWYNLFRPYLTGANYLVVEGAPAGRQVYLINLKPKSVVPGWLPAGRKWEQMNGAVRLLADNSGQGNVYSRSLYGESVSELVYEIPKGSARFVAAAGLGNREREASVVFRVFVDGVEKLNSGLYRFCTPVLPVVIDVKGAKELKLVVEDGGDGLAYDYAWWGDARFIRN